MKTFRYMKILLPLVVALCLPGCAATTPLYDEGADFGRVGLYEEPTNKDIDPRVAMAEKYPLGSKENPVRVNRPHGEYMYLQWLRCKDGNIPKFERVGSFGIGPFGNIIDGYDVKCEGSEPAQSMIFMDMYFPNHRETRAPEGFTWVGPPA